MKESYKWNRYTITQHWYLSTFLGVEETTGKRQAV